jgi:uncharacterized protein (TIGR00725 family)
MNKRVVQVGVMGSSSLSFNEEQLRQLDHKLVELADLLISNRCVLVTGETSGIPGRLVQIMNEHGGMSLGISPAMSETEHLENWGAGPAQSTLVVYTGFGLKGRNVINVRSSDIVLICGGSIGTLNEFTIAYDEGKIIGVLLETGGVAEMISPIVQNLNKKTGAQVFYSSDPKQLLDNCLACYRQQEA